MIPPLENHCGSWVITHRQTGKPVLETFSESTAEAVNRQKYKVETAAEYLARINQQIKEEDQ
ncbi:hypothetical protein GCM10007160_18490 [Litchfieldella qijiaojingensis]|uniref:Uncharacterized protein n=1 Tax=Litchfieldella qijiaojingensis TaxID=980347 RepID=A0ABQ2YPP8_9GAMM|nr:hypothetical protein GCM10007160_18490 [Halomonas qijiaojingensis]